jgi:hypothetical protein
MRGTHFIHPKMSQKPITQKPMAQKPIPQRITPAPIFDPTQPKPKPQCSEKHLAKLKAGREKSTLYRLLKQKGKKGKRKYV